MDQGEEKRSAAIPTTEDDEVFVQYSPWLSQCGILVGMHDKRDRTTKTKKKCSQFISPLLRTNLSSYILNAKRGKIAGDLLAVCQYSKSLR